MMVTNSAIQSELRRILLISALLIGLSIAHFVSPAEAIWLHDFWFKVTYIPIVLSGLWFGVRGGLTVGVITGLTYTVHIRLQLAGHHQHAQTGFWLELVLYLLIGIVVGWLADEQRRIQERLHQTNLQLQDSLASLKEKAEALLVAEESLRRADRLRAVGELAAGIAHEVRNPLSGILGAAKILADPATNDQNRAEFADLLAQETQRLDRVIGRLLDLARPGPGSAGTSLLANEIAFVGQLTEGTRRKSHADYDLSQVPHDIVVAVPVDVARQIILNLTLNALAALSERGGQIIWSAEIEGDRTTVRVRDTGGGVDSQIRDHLFEPFVTTRQTGGTGLGLAIVARLVRESGGEIDLESTGPSGTTFALTLPIASDRAWQGQGEGS
ncbi:MAG: ATP-binding protein [Candidatus Zixiibacteriota bacterium]